MTTEEYHQTMQRLRAQKGTAVVVGDSGEFFAGYVAPIRWNGWVQPAFCDAEVARIQAMLAAQALEDGMYEDTEVLTYHADVDQWHMALPSEATEPWVYERDVDGLFGIGAGHWTWAVAE